jgi:hypothetical protein
MWMAQMPTIAARLLVALLAGLILVGGGLDAFSAEPYAPDPQAPAAQRPLIQAAAGELPWGRGVTAAAYAGPSPGPVESPGRRIRNA